MAEWRDEGTLWDAAGPPLGEWVPVDTATGQWGTPTSTRASTASARTLSPVSMDGGGLAAQTSLAPMSIGQTAGVVSPILRQESRLDARAAQPQPSIWESLARGVGMVSPQGRAILQDFDTQQQQQLQNRLTLRRQELQEAQNERAEIRDDFNTFVKLSEIKSKALRNLYTDRFVADMQARGKSLPADFVEAFKKTGIDEGQQMAKLLEPLLTESGLDPAVATELLAEGRSPKDIMDAMELAQKQKRLRLEQQESAELTTGLATLGSASGTAPSAPAPFSPGTPPPPAQGPGQAAANVSMQGTPGAKEPLPIRMNNPLNIKQGPATQKWIDQGAGVPGDPAQDGGRFIKFQTPQQGVQAAKDLLTGPTYSGLSVDAALKKWSNNGYGGEIVTGVDPTTKIADLTPGELTRTMGAMMQREGGGTAKGAGSRDQVAGPGAPSQEPARLAQLNQQIDAMKQFLQANIGRGSERTRAAVTQVERLHDNLVKERDQLTESSRAGVRTEAEARSRTRVERELRGDTTLAEAFKGETPSLYDTQTGQTLDARMKVKDYEALPQGRATLLSPAMREQMEQLNTSVPIIAQLQTHIDKIYGPGGVFARMTPDELRLVNTIDPSKAGNIWAQMTQRYPELIQAQRFIEANASALARSLAGEKGAMAEGDVERARAMLPNLITALKVWPPSQIGVKLPDTRATALGTMNSVVDMINARGRTLLGNEQYTHPKLHRYQTADEAQQQTGSAAPLQQRPRPQDIAPEGTPAVGLNPNWRAPGSPPPAAPGATPTAQAAPAPTPTPPPEGTTSGQRALKAMTPAQLRQMPDALARTVMVNPWLAAAGLSPEQKNALMERLNRFEQQGARWVR